MFVYGTLKKGYGNHILLKGAKYLGNAEINGFAIYNLGAYPGIKHETGFIVYGEVYEINEKILKKVDGLEGEGWLYLRETVDATIKASGVKMNVYTYVFNRAVKIENRLDKLWEGCVWDD